MGQIVINQEVTPTTPLGGQNVLYTDATDKLYVRDSSAIDHEVAYVVATGMRGALVTGGGSQAVSGGYTQNTLAWGSTVYDTDAFFTGGDPTKLTVPAGVSFVRITAQLQFPSGTPATMRIASLFLNGGQVIFGLTAVNNSELVNGTDASAIQMTSPVLAVSPGDYFELIAFSSEAGATTTNTDYGFFSIEAV